MLFLIVYLVFVVLQAADAVTTYKCITAGVGKEGNPVLEYAISKIGLLPSIIIYKSVVVAAFSGAWLLGNKGIYLMLLVSAVYIYVIIENYKVMIGGK